MGDERSKRQLAELLARRFFLRFHISLILLFSFAAGLLTTRLLLALGVESLLWRWPLGVLGAWGGFLLAVRLWLVWVGLGHVLDRDNDTGGDGLDLVGDVVDLVPSGRGGGGTLSDLPMPSPASGGNFGGGGASSTFAGDGGGTASGFDLPDIDLGGGDEGCLPIILLLALLALLAAAAGVGVYMIWQAPLLLAEVAFEAAVAAGMIRSASRIRDPGWVAGAVRGSWKPFLLVLVLSILVAAALGHFVPEARTLLEAVGLLWAMT